MGLSGVVGWPHPPHSSPAASTPESDVKATGCSCTRDPGSEGLVQPLANAAEAGPQGTRSTCSNLWNVCSSFPAIVVFTTGKFWATFNESNKSGAGKVSVVRELTLLS